MDSFIKLGVSTCLLGEKVRWNAGGRGRIRRSKGIDASGGGSQKPAFNYV
jgi:uncharacterized protein YbbK (DUF523 family)